MSITILLISLFSIWIDIFLIPGLTDIYHIHTGIIAVIILLIYRHENAALFTSILYGLFLDTIIINVAFGIFLLIHFLMWLILRPFIYNLISSKRQSVLFIAFISSMAYILIFNFGIWAGNYFFADAEISFKLLISFKKIIISGVLNIILLFFILHFSKILIDFIKKWVFVKSTSRI